jgi:hypothetical protein
MSVTRIRRPVFVGFGMGTGEIRTVLRAATEGGKGAKFPDVGDRSGRLSEGGTGRGKG